MIASRSELLVSGSGRKVTSREVARGEARPAHGQDADGGMKIGEPESERRGHDQALA